MLRRTTQGDDRAHHAVTSATAAARFGTAEAAGAKLSSKSGTLLACEAARKKVLTSPSLTKSFSGHIAGRRGDCSLRLSASIGEAPRFKRNATIRVG